MVGLAGCRSTARLLLLLESKALTNDSLYDGSIRRVLDNYFRDGKGRKDFRPLFLLNDVLRYWRTLCLNYERTRTLQKPWWKTNLNLKYSRKLTVYSTVLAIVSERIRTTEDFVSFAKKVPLERLAETLDYIGDESLHDLFAPLLDNYESFLAAKSHAEVDVDPSEQTRIFSKKAESFSDFFCEVLRSKRLKQDLVKYVLI